MAFTFTITPASNHCIFTTEIMASVEVELGVTPETTYSISGKQIKFDSESDIAPYIKELTEKKTSKS